MNRFFICVALLIGFGCGIFVGSHFSPCCQKVVVNSIQEVPTVEDVYTPIAGDSTPEDYSDTDNFIDDSITIEPSVFKDIA